ncbi:uncharacterized protein LOC128760806 isoform X1 [Synchiropus splendidus]|uniref:uncharacterized protein LOC128760806 isoform X1 n=1 Tax=Synchiropus splendidus TaxID=270530 RepID=UPI00237EA4C6|nr:uncharacterized protein LOC128760806 isoform X1 [Synchiropus splendidus]
MASPEFRFEGSSSELTLRPTEDAVRLTHLYKQQVSSWDAKNVDTVRQEAKARVLEQGGDPADKDLLLAESELQFGPYAGQTFRWLLENDVHYACRVLVFHEKLSATEKVWPSADTKNKHALASYAKLFPPMVAAIDRRRLLEARRPSDGIHNMTLGFGEHGDRTFRSLYGARDVRTRHYVQYVRKLKIPEGSQIYRLQQYILARDKEPSVHASVDPKTESDAEPMEVAAEVDSQDSTIRDNPAAPVQSSTSLVGPQAARAPAGTVSAQTGSGAQLLPRGWRATLPEEQQDWVGRALFCQMDSGKSVLKKDLRLWWYPPGPRPIYSQPPTTSHPFFQQPFFLWMPYKMWAYPLKCPTCKASLRAAGLYKTVRRVLDRHSWYFMGTEYLECYTCRKKVAGWSQAILEQLDLSHRMDFPAVLTYRLACDKTLINALKERTLGNSATRLHATLVEEHTTAWIHRTKKYLSMLQKLEVRQSQPFPEMHPVPGVSWLIGVYVRDAISRLPETKARITSVFGTILKMVSTKKVTKKLAGAAAGSAAWSTNVGNEHGQVLMSVLTAAEGDGLADMASGLVRRYRDAGQAPPKVLYVDRDCCTSVGQSRVGQLFHEWSELAVRLDVWHFMRRFTRGVTTNTHQLYGLFMARLLYAIFEWDATDVARLEQAKQSQEGADVSVTLTAKELARHCRRHTRGVMETCRLIQEVLDTFWTKTDTQGVALIDRARMEEIWRTQRRHLDCIQDPAGVALYTQTSEITKGGVKLPVYRCARGSTSLESFHLHLWRFIPGTSASDVHFQVYLLEGLARWNEDRGRASVKKTNKSALRCYNTELVDSFSHDTQMFLGKTLVETYTVPREYTGELIGVEYLYSQTGAVLQQDLGDPDEEESSECFEQDGEEGLDDDDEEEQLEEVHLLKYHHALLLQEREKANTEMEQQLQEEGEEEQEEEEIVVGPDGHPGYQHVVALALALAELRHRPFVSQRQANDIIALWQRLPERDKQPVSFPPRHQDRFVRGHLRTSHRRADTAPSMESMKRTVPGQDARSAHSPKLSRLMEALMLELCRAQEDKSTMTAGVRTHRWHTVVKDYKLICDNVVSCHTLMANTRIALYEVNQRTVSSWYNERSKATARETLQSSVISPSAPQMSKSLPTAQSLLPEAVQPDRPTQHNLSADESGLAVTSVEHVGTSSSSVDTLSAAPATTSPSSSAAGPSTSSSSHPARTVSRTTLWRWKVQQERARVAQEKDSFATPEKVRRVFNCSHCGQPRTRITGHSRHKKVSFCSQSDGRTVEQWHADMVREEEEASARNRPSSSGT